MQTLSGYRAQNAEAKGVNVVRILNAAQSSRARSKERML